MRMNPRAHPQVIIDDTHTSPDKNEQLELMESQKHTIQIRFGKMFINHMIEKLQDFKQMLVIEIEEIMQKGDYDIDHHNDFGGLVLRKGPKNPRKHFDPLQHDH